MAHARACLLLRRVILDGEISLSLRTRKDDETSGACAAVRLRESVNTVETARERRRPLPPQRSTEIAERARTCPSRHSLRSDPRSGGTTALLSPPPFTLSHFPHHLSLSPTLSLPTRDSCCGIPYRAVHETSRYPPELSNNAACNNVASEIDGFYTVRGESVDTEPDQLFLPSLSLAVLLVN